MIRSMRTNELCANLTSLTEQNKAHAYDEQKYISGRPYTQVNIAGLINNNQGRNHYTNCRM